MGASKEITPLNLNAKQFCHRIGLPYHGDILKCFRELKLVEFFKVGKKFLYRFEDADLISEKLRKREISIKTDGGYYVTLNDNCFDKLPVKV